MTRRLPRLLVAACLLWTGANLCPMPQAQCEDEAKPSCGCEHGQKAKCCSGVHLVEAGTGSVSLPAAPSVSQGLPPAAPASAPDLAPAKVVLVSDSSPPAQPPPRQSLGRSPPAA